MQHKIKESKMKKVKGTSIVIALFLSFSFFFSTVTAQESINATGGKASGTGGTVTYSVGQLVYQTHIGTDGSVAEGVQQPYEISVITAIEETEGISLSVKAYPNPASDYLILSIDEFDISGLSYRLYDMRGKLLQNKKITGNQTIITMSDLFPGNYFVKVYAIGRNDRAGVIQGNIEVKTFKIIKN